MERKTRWREAQDGEKHKMKKTHKMEKKHKMEKSTRWTKAHD